MMGLNEFGDFLFKVAILVFCVSTFTWVYSGLKRINSQMYSILKQTQENRQKIESLLS